MNKHSGKNPYQDFDINTIKKANTFSTNAGETINDGKPYKARPGLINLNEETRRFERKNAHLLKMIKEKAKIAVDTNEEGDMIIKNTNINIQYDEEGNIVDKKTGKIIDPQTIQQFLNEDTHTHISNPLLDSDEIKAHQVNSPSIHSTTHKITKLESLLKDHSGQDYIDKEFKINIPLTLPPRKALLALEQYFKIDIVEELTDMLINKIKLSLENGVLKNQIHETVNKYINTKK